MRTNSAIAAALMALQFTGLLYLDRQATAHPLEEASEGPSKALCPESLAAMSASGSESSPRHTPIPLPAAILAVTKQNFIEHNGGPVSTPQGEKMDDPYLALNIDYSAVLEMRKSIETATGEILRDRGQAHITVITPVEFETLKTKISIKEMNEMARKADIQNARLQIVGIGRGQVSLNDKNESTYFVIVESEDLLQLRKAIFERFAARGGPKDRFNWRKFHPHITVGFTKRDLYEQDGVIKDAAHSLDRRFILVPQPASFQDVPPGSRY